MPERFGDILTLLMGALAVGYVVYEIERRRRKLHDVWDVLDEEDALLTEKLEEMVESGAIGKVLEAVLTMLTRKGTAH